MSFFKQLFRGDWRLPERWTMIRSFAVVVPISKPDVHRAKAGIMKALKIRNILMNLCQDRYLPDEVFQAINKRRSAGEVLSDEEANYVRQADANYLVLVCEKMSIALLYEGDFFGLSPEERHALQKLIERYPGCSLVSGREGIGGRVVYSINPEGSLADEEARDILHRLIC